MNIFLLFKKAYWHLFKTMPCEMILKNKWDEYRKIERRYYNKNYDITGINVNNPDVIFNRNIFVYWDKGFENAPIIVKKCYQRLLDIAPVDWNIISLSDENIKDYVKLPDFVEKMLLKNEILRANYSDLLRTALLYFYGGIWVDSTCLFTKEIPQSILDDDFFMFSIRNTVPYTPMMFENWFIRANKGNFVLGRVLENLLYYFNKTKTPKKIYFVWFYILLALYRHDECARNLMDKISYCGNQDALLMSVFYGLETNYNEILWHQITNKCFVQKLTYKYDKALEQLEKDIFLKHILNLNI